MVIKPPTDLSEVSHYHRRRAKRHSWHAVLTTMAGMVLLLFWLSTRLFGHCSPDAYPFSTCKSYYFDLIILGLFLYPLISIGIELWTLGVFVERPPVSLAPGHAYELFLQSVQEAGGGWLQFIHMVCCAVWRGISSLKGVERFLVLASLVLDACFIGFGVWLVFLSPILL